ncbi:hypothetical protein [Boudabousia tangfeifanii]|uniref:hypothetical protein n=1 Tax=Boudabousia tangfeifanii TaxID=1912795 RepID=UPI0012ED0827|nr:hypothetical protein [Boudabousia tangfeifanii]
MNESEGLMLLLFIRGDKLLCLEGAPTSDEEPYPEFPPPAQIEFFGNLAEPVTFEEGD